MSGPKHDIHGPYDNGFGGKYYECLVHQTQGPTPADVLKRCKIRAGAGR